MDPGDVYLALADGTDLSPVLEPQLHAMVMKDVLRVAWQANDLVFLTVRIHADAASIVRLEHKVLYLLFYSIEERAAVFLVSQAFFLRQSSISAPPHTAV